MLSDPIHMQCPCCATASDFYVENVFEELDAPGEVGSWRCGRSSDVCQVGPVSCLTVCRAPYPVFQWFYNSTTQLLYLYYNGTGSPPEKNQYVVTSNVKVLFNITGTQAEPVTGVSLLGLGYVVGVSNCRSVGCQLV